MRDDQRKKLEEHKYTPIEKTENNCSLAFIKLQFKYCIETLNAFSDLQMAFLACFSSQFKGYFTSYQFTQASVPLQSQAQEQSLLLLVPRCTCNTARILRLFRVLINKTEQNFLRVPLAYSINNILPGCTCYTEQPSL